MSDIHPASHSSAVLPTEPVPACQFAPLRWWCWLALAGASVCVGLLRWHTLTEPLDCDEAAYAYVGHRLLAGDRLYADVFENKPPAAYLIFAAAIAIGGYEELTIRLLSLPFVLATMIGIWSVARRLAGNVAAVWAVLLFAVVSHDPFTFGETANLEVFMNPFLMASMYAAIRCWNRPDGIWRLTAGLALGMASLIKHVVLPHGVLLVVFTLMQAGQTRGGLRSRQIWRQLAMLAAGCALPWLAAFAFCALQDVLVDFLHAVFVYGPALASESSRYSGAERLLRFVLGNPEVPWWGVGTWPLLLMASVGAFLWRKERRPGMWLVLAWSVACFISAYLPGLFWQHYYQLAIPPLVVWAAGGLATSFENLAELRPSPSRAAFGWAATRLIGQLSLFAWQGYVQYATCVALSPDEIVRRHKDGTQWLVARQLGRDLGEALGPSEKLYVCGYESPVHFYSRMDSVTPYFFLDPLMRKHLRSEHRLVSPRLRKIARDVAEQRPAVIFMGEQAAVEIIGPVRHEYQLIGSVPVPGKTVMLLVRIDCVQAVLASGSEPDHQSTTRDTTNRSSGASSIDQPQGTRPRSVSP